MKRRAEPSIGRQIMNNEQTGSDMPVLDWPRSSLIKKGELSVQALNLVIYKQYADFNFGKANKTATRGSGVSSTD